MNPMPEKIAVEVVSRVYLLSQSSRGPATTPDAHFLLRPHAAFTKHWMKTKTYPRPPSTYSLVAQDYTDAILDMPGIFA